MAARLDRALILLGLTFFAVMIVNEATIPPLVVFGIVFLILAFAVWRWSHKRWVLILATVVAAAALVSNVPFILDDLPHPETAFTFIPTLLAVVASLVAIAAGLGAILRFDNGLTRPLVGAVVVVVAAFAALSVFATLNVEDAEAQPDDVMVVAEAVEYPETLTASAGTIGIFLDNRDLVRHTFVIEGQDVKEEMPGSSTQRLEVTLEAGEYTHICDVQRHERMEGVLTVS